MTEERVPANLLRSVEKDWRPVTPLPSPLRRALTLLPLGLLLLVAAPLFWGWRENLSALGQVGAWGLSGVEVLAGLLVVGVALREAVPGRELSAQAVGLTTLVALALFVGITLVTSAMAPERIPPGVFWRWTWECLGMAMVPSVLALAPAAWLVSRALPNRPAIAGALYGLGAGLMADSGFRLFCRVSTPAHVLVSHGAALGLLAVLGALAASRIERAKRPARLPGASVEPPSPSGSPPRRARGGIHP